MDYQELVQEMNNEKNARGRNMNDFTISIDWPSAQGIVLQVLKQDLECLRADWHRRYSGQGGAIFTTDIQEDLEEISAHISAYKKIIKYYGEDTN